MAEKRVRNMGDLFIVLSLARLHYKNDLLLRGCFLLQWVFFTFNGQNWTGENWTGGGKYPWLGFEPMLSEVQLYLHVDAAHKAMALTEVIMLWILMGDSLICLIEI